MSTKIKRIRSKKQALEDLAGHLDEFCKHYDKGQLQSFLNNWSLDSAELIKMEDPGHNEAGLILSFASLGAKAAILHHMGSKIAVAQPEGEDNSVKP